MHRFTCVSLAALLLCWGAQAHASAAPAATIAPEGPQQKALSVSVQPTASGPQLQAALCEAPNCANASYVTLAWPQPPTDLSHTQLRVLQLGRGRHAVHVIAGEGSSRWQALVAAPVDGSDKPLALWSAASPEPVPVDSVPVGDLIVTTPSADGSVQVVVGDTRDDIQLCGRRSLLMPRVLDPADMRLKHVKMQQLPAQEREQAEKITAERAPGPFVSMAHLLAARGASSALGAPSNLTDNDPETVWSEGRGAEGRGEFVTMRAPSGVPLTEIGLTIRPSRAQVPQGAAPRSLWLATDNRLLLVTLPEDAWKNPGAAYVVRFKEPVQTGCVALVLEDAFDQGKDARVTIAEVAARSAFDSTPLPSVVAALAGGGERAQAAAAVLLRAGSEAKQAVIDRYAELDDAGRLLAMDVLDGAKCEQSAPLFASQLGSASQAEREHARDRIHRCARHAAPALEEVVQLGAGCAPGYRDEALCKTTSRSPGVLDAYRLAAADELASVAPALAVKHLTPYLSSPDTATRQKALSLVARTSARSEGVAAIGEQLAKPGLQAPAALDLLRVAQENVGAIRAQAGQAFAVLSSADNDLPTRYLLLGPAARLAQAGDVRGTRYLYDSMLHDREPMVRTRAAELAKGIDALTPVLMTAMEDPHVRVRDAAAKSLQGVEQAEPYLVRRLRIDDWPMVRADAARALGQAGASRQADDALALALGDEAALVRAEAASALGNRGASVHAERIRKLASDQDEQTTVRLAAVRALGQMCDAKAVDLLTDMAQLASIPYAPESANGLGTAAIAALGDIHPKDLDARIGPVAKARHAPQHVKVAAHVALQKGGKCNKPRR